MNHNYVALIGRMTKDPEFTEGVGKNDSKMTEFTIAVNRGYGKEAPTDFLPCTCWGKTAINVHKYCVKGQLVFVEGSIRIHKFEVAQETKYRTEISCRNVIFLEKSRKKESETQSSDLDFTREEDDLPF